MDFHQNDWDDSTRKDLCRLLEIAISEDIGQVGDLTTHALINPTAKGNTEVRLRQEAVLAGLPAVDVILQAIDPQLHWQPQAHDGDQANQGDCIGILSGPVVSLLQAERIVLNFLGRLSGIATRTKYYVDLVKGLNVRIYDTRKTTPGWRKLEKYAVRCGGGHNHRTGLYDAVLIKDNHLAFGSSGPKGFQISEAVSKAREYCRALPALVGQHVMIEVEVDTLDQLQQVLPSRPDIVLLDNMSPQQLAEAVHIRNETQTASNTQTELEASGGINPTTVRAVAQSGVDRISIGALTHSAVSIDFGLDYKVSD